MAELNHVQTDIDRVTVFRNGALVIRRGQATSPEVSIGGLPLLFSTHSLRVRPSSGVVREMRETCRLETHPTPPPNTEARRRALHLEAEQIADEARTLDALARALEGLGPSEPPERLPPGLPDPSQWLALQGFAAERLDALDAARRDLARRRAALAEAQAQLDRTDLGDLEPPRFTRGLTFSLEGDEDPSADRPVDFEVEYFVAAARWVPTYRLELEEGRARLVLAALVAQATGEDWSSAALAFSTADLSRDTTLPPLDSWRLGAAQPARASGFRPLPSDLPTLFMDYREAVDLRPPPSPLISALLVDGDGPSPAKPPPAPSGELSPMDDLNDGAPILEREETSILQTKTGIMPAPSAPPPPQGAPAPMLDADDTFIRAAVMPAKKRGGILPGFGGGGGGMPKAEAPSDTVYGGQPPEAALPPRLRYAWLRLAGPDEDARGSLQPMNPFEHLWALLEGQGVDQPEVLRRAMDGLEQAANRLRHAPLPPGTRELDQCHFQHTYPAQGQHHIPGDGAFHRVGVYRQEGAARIECRTVPRESRDVFRFCRLTTPESTPLPEGPLHVTVDGTFRTAARLRGTGGGTDLALNLGLEPDVRVVARRVSVRQSDKGLVSHTTQVEHTVSITVRSALDVATPVLVYDRLPIVGDEVKDLTVELLSSTPTPIRDDRDPHGDPLKGGLHWHLQVPPKGAVEIEYSYMLALPARVEVEGGNRRE